MRKLLAVAAAAAVVAAPVLVSAEPAAAAVLPPGVTVVDTPSVFTSNSPQTAEAKCPAGKRVLGGGVRVNAGVHVIVTREEPISAAAGDSYLVTAEEDPIGTTLTWSVQAFAICSDPIPGLRLISAISQDRSDAVQSASVDCPSGTNLLGAGGRILDGQGQVNLSTVVNGGALNPHGVIANGKEPSAGFAGNWSVVAYGVCATVNTFGDAQIVDIQSAEDTSPNKVVQAVCPAGMTVTGGAGFANTPGVVASVNVDANRTRIQIIAKVNDTSDTSRWFMGGMAVCVK